MFSVPFSTTVRGTLLILADDDSEAFTKASKAGIDFQNEPDDAPIDVDTYWVDEWSFDEPVTFSAADVQESQEDRKEHPDYDATKEAGDEEENDGDIEGTGDEDDGEGDSEAARDERNSRR